MINRYFLSLTEMRLWFAKMYPLSCPSGVEINIKKKKVCLLQGLEYHLITLKGKVKDINLWFRFRACRCSQLKLQSDQRHFFRSWSQPRRTNIPLFLFQFVLSIKRGTKLTLSNLENIPLEWTTQYRKPNQIRWLFLLFLIGNGWNWFGKVLKRLFCRTS